MVAQGIVEADHSPVPTNEQLRALNPLEKTRYINAPAAGEIKYDHEGVRQDRLERRQSVSNARRCSPWWFPFAIPALHTKCPDCPQHFAEYYFTEWREHRFDDSRKICTDCQAWEFQMMVNRLRDWEDPDGAAMRRAGISTSSSQSAFTAQQMDRADEALEEVNLSEQPEDLEMEIVHYRATGELQDPHEMTTVERQFEHPDEDDFEQRFPDPNADSFPPPSNETPCDPPECSAPHTNSLPSTN